MSSCIKYEDGNVLKEQDQTKGGGQSTSKAYIHILEEKINQ